ncbi:MAG TPA: hypothetical protein DD426_03230, partial [Clostridiaceae bacterium]|nr:hypothetical protein [Clostridiaceae bacterium]
MKEYYEYFQERAKNYTYKGIPVKNVSMPYNFYGTDGIFTTACGIRGASNFIMDIIDDPDYAHELLDFITTAIIERMKKVRKYLGKEQKSMDFGYADDSIVLLSPSLFKEIVLPYIKRIYDEFSIKEGKRSIHLCGDAQRFFPILEKELNVKSFDTGYPIAFDKLYNELSSDTQILGGPNIML